MRTHALGVEPLEVAARVKENLNGSRHACGADRAHRQSKSGANIAIKKSRINSILPRHRTCLPLARPREEPSKQDRLYYRRHELDCAHPQGHTRTSHSWRALRSAQCSRTTASTASCIVQQAWISVSHKNPPPCATWRTCRTLTSGRLPLQDFSRRREEGRGWGDEGGEEG